MPEMYYGFNIAIVLPGLFMWVILNIVLNNHLIALRFLYPTHHKTMYICSMLSLLVCFLKICFCLINNNLICSFFQFLFTWNLMVLLNVNKISINNVSVILSQWVHWWETVLLCFVEIFHGIVERFSIVFTKMFSWNQWHISVKSTETFHGNNGIFP